MASELPPSFTQKPSLHQEDDGNRLVFECQLVANPKPEINWFRGEEQLTEDERTFITVNEIEKNKFQVSLELNNVVESDAGSYKVKAKNKAGVVAASINLNFSRKFFNLNDIPRSIIIHTNEV